MKSLFTALTIAVGYILSVLVLGLLVPTLIAIIASNVLSNWTFLELVSQPGYVLFSVIGCVIAMIYYGVTVYND